jgi:polar amino acid transport system substrate-binding protein
MRTLWLWIVLLLLGMGCGGTAAQAADRKLLIVGEAWAPFEFEENGNVVGIDVDIARHILTKMGIDFEMRILPWSRAWSMVENGQADAVFSTSRKDDRQPYLWYPKEDMWTSEYVFFVRRDRKQPHFVGYTDVQAQQLQVGVVRDNTYNDAFWKAFPRSADGKLHALLQPARNAEINFKKLARGRIDLYILDKTIGLYTLAQMQLQQELDYYDTALFSKGYPMPFVRKSDYPNLQNIAAQFEQELIALKASDTYQQIREKWFK